MAKNPGDSTVVGGGFGVRIPRDMANSYTVPMERDSDPKATRLEPLHAER